MNKQKQNKSKTKSRHIQIDQAFYCLIYPTNIAMVSLMDGFTVWRQNQKDPIFFNKKVKIGRPEHSLTPTLYVR